MAVALQVTERQLCRALINAIATHPLIKNPGIYYPAIVGDRVSTEPVRIEKWRLFGGIELIEPGLTLAVFPFHSSFKTTSASYSRSVTDKTMNFGDVGNRSELGRSNYSTVGGVIRIVIQLYYREASFDAPIKIKSDLVSFTDITSITPHGEHVQLGDELGTADLSSTEYAVEDHMLDVQILPGEEILRDYIPLLRYVIRDITELRPFSIRNPFVHVVDYPTSNWIREGENLIFHTAYIVVEYDISEPGIRSGNCIIDPEQPVFSYPHPEFITVEDQRLDKYSL
jgi:hypothetical protein